jgi:hypothetical protein
LSNKDSEVRYNLNKDIIPRITAIGSVRVSHAGKNPLVRHILMSQRRCSLYNSPIQLRSPNIDQMTDVVIRVRTTSRRFRRLAPP